VAGLFTRCPGCESVYRLNARQVASADGTVRCGTCGKTFNALTYLFADHPARDETPLERAGVPPLLRQPAVAQPQLPGFEPEGPPDEPNERGPTLSFPDLLDGDEPGPSQRPAQLASLAFGLALLAQILLQWLSPDSALARWLDPASDASTGNVGRQALQITSRDMHRHPSLDDAIIISATLRHRGAGQRDWPILEVRLYDPSQQVLGVRRLQPIDYLDDADAVSRGMPPDVLTPIILEFVVGTTEPSGFDFRFF
jgi:predicted Zn finger-like uncharacterized protein